MPSKAPTRSFAISAVDVPTSGVGSVVRAAFVKSTDAAAVKAGQLQPEPLVLHVAAGECVTVTLKNERIQARASFHLGELLRRIGSSGINVGFNPEQTAAPGETRTYKFYADKAKLDSALVADFGDDDSGKLGLYGATVVAPAGATFTDPVTGAATDVGSQVDVHVAGTAGYRDFTLLLADQDPEIGQNTMPYPTVVQGPALINYAQVQRPADANTFSSTSNGDPPTPLLRAYVGDPVRVHALVAPASEQTHVFTLGGMSWPWDPRIPNSEEFEERAVNPWGTVDPRPEGGAGGRGKTVGDFFYGDIRRPFTEAGMWGLFRVLPTTGSTCPIKVLDGLTCTR